MAGKNSEKLQKTKEELQQEIDKIESLLDDSLGKVKQDVASADPRKQIQKNPLPAVGIAVVSGFLLSKIKFNKRKEDPSRSVGAGKKDVGSALWKEVRQRVLRIAVQKAGDYVEDYLEEVIPRKKAD